MADGVAILESEVRELIRRRGLDPSTDAEATRVLIADAVADYDERALLGRVPRLPDPDEAAKALHDAVVGLGPLQKYLDDPAIEEIWINASYGAGRCWQLPKPLEYGRFGRWRRRAGSGLLRTCCGLCAD